MEEILAAGMTVLVLALWKGHYVLFHSKNPRSRFSWHPLYFVLLILAVAYATIRLTGMAADEEWYFLPSFWTISVLAALGLLVLVAMAPKVYRRVCRKVKQFM